MKSTTAKAGESLALASSRIVTLDILRGFFILLIASIHLAYYPSFFGLFDGRGDLWVSEAEGFFFISGLLIGIIRHQDIVRHSLGHANRRMLRRGLKLYLTASVLSIVYLIIGRLTTAAHIAGTKGGLDTGDNWIHLLYRIFTFQYSYGWADFLVYYAAFMFVAPLVVWLLAKGRWWVVVSLTLAVWVWRWSGDRGVYNPLLQWQVYFFLGATIGYYWKNLSVGFAGLTRRTRVGLEVGFTSAAVLIYVVSMALVFIPAYSQDHDLPQDVTGSVGSWIVAINQNQIYNSLLVNGRIGLLRPLVLLVFFGGIFVVARRYERVIKRTLGWLLVPFGSNSLYVYILQSVVLFTIPFFIGPSSFWINSLIELATVGLIWLSLRQRFLFRLIPR